MALPGGANFWKLLEQRAPPRPRVSLTKVPQTEELDPFFFYLVQEAQTQLSQRLDIN